LSRYDASDILNDVKRLILVPRRILRLRGYLYHKIPWLVTNDIITKLSDTKQIKSPFLDDPDCVSHCDYLDQNNRLKDECVAIALRNLQINRRWTELSQILGNHAENLFERAFIDEGYEVEKKCQFKDNSSIIEMDLFCVKGDLELGVEVKNISSDVFLDPTILKKPNLTHRQIRKHFEYCFDHNIVPILIAPFIDNLFYRFINKRRGLMCQTYLQLFPLDQAKLHEEIREAFKFGNTRAADELPDHIEGWIRKIPRKV